MGGCCSQCWNSVASCLGFSARADSEQRVQDNQQPLLHGSKGSNAGKGDGRSRPRPSSAERHGLQGLERRLERKYSGKKITSKSTDNLLGLGHRDVSLDYELGSLLGQGTFGVVRLATHKQTQARYACKTIVKSKLRRAVELEDVKREVAILQRLSSHPNVAALVATYEDEARVNLILELCEGGELCERIVQQGSLTEREAARYFTPMVEVVRHCHSQGIMHRDIKPENFLLSSRSDDALVRAADFGLSQFFSPHTRFQSLVGSAFYVAPEVLRRDYGPSADIWSLGVCLYILLSGLTPFWGESEEDIFKMVLAADLDFDTHPWPHVSRAAKDLVRLMMCRDASKRPTAAEVLQHPWLQRSAPDVQLDAVVITRMRNFAAMSRVKRAAMLVAVRGMLQDDAPELRALFLQLDTDRSGRLSREEFRNGMQGMGAQLSEEDLTELVRGADIDGDGEIDYPEFLAATLWHSHVRRAEFLKSLFAKFDEDGSGTIDLEELRRLLGLYGVSGREVEAVLQQADKDGDNLISFSEFQAFMNSSGGTIQEAARGKAGILQPSSPPQQCRLGEAAPLR